MRYFCFQNEENLHMIISICVNRQGMNIDHLDIVIIDGFQTVNDLNPHAVHKRAVPGLNYGRDLIKTCQYALLIPKVV